MKVILDGTAISDKATGSSLYALKLIDYLCRIDSSVEFEVLVLNSIKSSNAIYKFSYPNLIIKTVNVPSIGPIRDFIFNLKSTSWINTSIYHCLNTNYPITVNPIEKGIVTIHDLKYINIPAYFGRFGHLKSNYLKFIINNSIKFASHIICVSESTKKDLINFAGSNKNTILDRVSVIYEASTLDKTQMLDYDHNHRYNIKKPYFLFVGEWRPHKNIEVMLEAFYRFINLNNKNKHYSFVLLGSKHRSFSSKLEILNKLKKNCVLIDHLPSGALRKLYNDAFALINVSHYEGFGLPVVEAMQENIPVIVSNASSLPELVGDPRFMVDPNKPEDLTNIMNKFVLDNEFYNSAIANSSQRKKLFSWALTAKKTLEIYRRVYTN